MDPTDFVDFTQGINTVNQYKPVDSDGNNFSWLSICEFKYERKLMVFKFRVNLDYDYRTCLLGPRCGKKNMNPKHVFDDTLQLYQTFESLLTL